MSQVTCGSCNAAIDLGKADVTGRGYRCTACSLKASLAADGGYNDVGDHLTPAERVQRAKSATTEMFGGAALGIGGVACFFFLQGTIGLIIVFAGLGAISHGFLTKREMTGQRTY